MAIYTFDGRADPQLTISWTSDRNALLTAVDSIICGQETFSGSGVRYCTSPSTNLYGTLIFAAKELERQYLAPSNGVRMTSRGWDGAILIFTDGEDLAGRNTYTEARAEIERVGALVFVVAVMADPASTEFKPADQQLALDQITHDRNAEFYAATYADVPASYDLASQKLIAFFSRSYRISYCSPRRARAHTLDLMAKYQGVLGSRMEFIQGMTVRYVQQTNSNSAGLARTDGLITTVYPIDSTYSTVRYGVSFPSGTGIAPVIAMPSELDVMYDTSSFTSFSCMQNPATTQQCSIPAAGALAPYTCTGGGLYNCATKKCDCAMGTCNDNANSQCFNRDQSLTPPSSVSRACPNGLPVAPQQVSSFTRSSDSTLSMIFTAKCADGTPIGGLTFSPCPDLSSITILESRDTGFQKISLYESRPRITCVPKPAHLTSLMLLDMSDSILKGYGGLQRLKDFAVAYVQGITQDLTSHIVSVYTFDGQYGINLLANFGSPSAAITAIQNLDCGSNRCVDPSSNLNGAIVQGNNVLSQYHAANTFAADGTGRQPFLVILTDGADQAQRFTDAEAVAASSNGTGIFAIGLQGEPRSDPIQRGVDVNRLTMLARNNIYIVPTAADLKAAFLKVGTSISSAAASSYRLDYCSPKRSGMQKVRIQLTHFNAQTYWEQEFDANFNCDNEACSKCLSNLNQDFSCASQPGPANQNFACANNLLPVVKDGYCRCPCSDASMYPPSTQVGPGPITCEKQGTCSSGGPVSCTTHGGLNQTVQNFQRFGASIDSRVSMEFIPSCADGFPIPNLKMSVCDSLSDFRIYETDSMGQSLPISKFESEPRISCFPDVVSLILLDTSGSITGGGTEAAVRSAVIDYLQTMHSQLKVTHTIGVYAFDGRPGVQEIQSFTSDYQTVLTRMQNWGCSEGNFCGIDPSTNLYGAVITAEQMLRNAVGTYTWRQRPYLIMFTDGTDQAARATEAQAISAITQATADYKLQVFGVGILGERANGMMGLDSEALSRLAPAGAFLATNSTGVAAEFDKVASGIVELTQNSDTTTYRLDYCSPKRKGITTVTVELVREGQVAKYTTTFNASMFQCSDNSDLCSSCLSGRVYSCTNQPQMNGGEQQFFQCSDGKPPTDVNGQCKCPCVGTYPPDITPTPTFAPSVGQVTTPSFTPASGTYTTAVSVSIISEAGATIYYTVNGATPTAASTMYTGPFTWNSLGTATLRAIAMVNGKTASNIGVATYTITSVPVPPTPPVITNTPVTPPTPSGCSRFGLSGFTSNSLLNTIYTLDNTKITNGFPTFWSDNGNLFIYKCLTDGYFYITSKTDYSSSIGLCLGSARTSSLGSGTWHQTSSGSFSAVSISLSCYNGGGVFTAVPGSIYTPYPNTVYTLTPASPGAPTGVLQRQQITVSADSIGRSNTENNVISSITPGAAGHCQTATPSMFQGIITMPIINNVGSLIFTPLMSGTTTITCSLSNNGLVTVLPAITLLVQGGTTSTKYKNLRIALKQTTSSFDQNAFIAAINTLVSTNTQVLLNWVCPESHCWNVKVCTALAPPCRISFSTRVAASLQSSDVVYVDFDLAGYGDNQLQNAANSINTDVQNCWDNKPCVLQGQNPDRKAILVNNDGTATFGGTKDGGGSSGLQWWEWVLIIAGCVLFCCLLIIIIVCLMRGKKGEKENTKGQEYDDVKRTQEMQPYSSSYGQSPGQKKDDGDMAETSYYDESYSSPSGSQSQSYYSTSYAPEKFDVDEQVKALYVDGQWYDATIWSQAPDGTYEVKWYDGQHSDGIPADQLKKA
eukprot:TRINITY_DN2312_c0_g2_i1.p1 TRINITY_DN2312_c0_g2~~TRINITY_DN2312_c0_g2_i1.p1  ORF type:complete len:1960 (+),score=518.80 TRINITY_DN2312_c0_g2_i1:524-5881(+)